ncbi:hypothetical protein BB934_19825 [Microvirga ossetica]|uniref:Uncharacterized protein n=1 Tax=Microvirga ossetica TaxID=1882682 RepID=A0A1B2EJN2_9HYPH|nr:hypothetical protein [Microvirga ossetica]ANY80195.1 hypothetical protein BB934_19825 [Microvirga ossetica]
MSIERAEAALESAIAAHVAASFQRNDRGDEPETTAAQIRSRITDRFQAVEIPIEQDNQPPALVVFYRRIAAAFAPIAREPESAERSSSLADLKNGLATLRSALPLAPQRSKLDHAKTRLLIERQQLLMQNEFTEGFGRIEVWILSIAALTLVLLEAVGIVWALPLLALSIARSWQMDRRCKARLRKVAEIDALVERIDLMPQTAC